MSGNSIDDEAMNDIAQFLKENTVLTKLSLAQNQLSSNEAIMLFNALRSNKNSNVKALNVDYVAYNLIDDKPVNYIAQFLMDNDALVKLDIILYYKKFSH